MESSRGLGGPPFTPAPLPSEEGGGRGGRPPQRPVLIRRGLSASLGKTHRGRRTSRVSVSRFFWIGVDQSLTPSAKGGSFARRGLPASATSTHRPLPLPETKVRRRSRQQHRRRAESGSNAACCPC